jgi:flagellar P-ring protein precursor FlgI
VLPRVSLALLIGAVVASQAAGQHNVRIKDLTLVKGDRTELLIGMGLVTGLNGTGGKNPSTRIFAQNLLQRFGVRADPSQRSLIRTDAKEKTDNLSVVTVTAEMPVYSQKGSRIDVTVAAVDDASSLQGGILMPTPLIAIDKQVYAMASGAVSLGGGFTADGSAARVQKNHPTSGGIPNGAVVEKEVCRLPLARDGYVRLALRQADFQTATRIAQAVNTRLPGTACVADAGNVDLIVPPALAGNPNHLIALVQSLTVTPDVVAKVVINERTGTVVIGEHVRLSRVAITHGNLAVITSESPVVSQPAPFSQGETTVVPRTQVDVTEERGALNVLETTTTVGELVQALNALGVTSRDLSAILQELKASGALHADLEVN